MSNSLPMIKLVQIRERSVSQQSRKKLPSPSRSRSSPRVQGLDLSWINGSTNYEQLTIRDIAKEQQRLRECLKQLNLTLAIKLKDKAVSLKLKPAYVPRTVGEELQVIESQLVNGESILRNLKLSSAQLEQRLSFISHKDLYFVLSKNIEEVSEEIETVKRDIKDSKRFNSLRKKKIEEPTGSEWTETLNEVSKINARKESLVHATLANKVNIEKALQTMDSADRRMSELQYDFAVVNMAESGSNQANRAEEEVGRLKKSIQSMNKVLKSVKETFQREYLKKLKEMQKLIDSSNSISDRLRAAFEENTQRTREIEQLKREVGGQGQGQGQGQGHDQPGVA